MSAITLAPHVPADCWSLATAEVNAWRGAAIHCFAEAEAAVSETLLDFAATNLSMKLRHLVGQRLDDLDVVLDRATADVGHAVQARDALTAFRALDHLRPFLCHGVAKIALERGGDWIVVLKVMSFRARAAERTTYALEKRTANDLLADIKRRRSALTRSLDQLREKLASPAS